MSLSSLEIISVGGSFMEDSLGSYLDERDPRKRKRSEDMHSPSRIRSDNWAQRAEAFIHKVKDPPLGGHSPNAGGANNNVSDGRVREGGGFGSSSYGYTGGGSGVVVGYPSAFSANPPPGYPSRGTAGSNPPSSSFNSHYNNKVSGDSKDGGAMVHSGGGVNHQKRKSNKRRSRDESSSSSSESESEEESQVPSDQKAKLRIQKDQYEKAQEKLEAQLIKLKEQREALKEGGARHEDKIMKDNARLQKEVKNRLTHMSDVLDKISLGLDTLPIQEEENKPLRRKSSSRERSVLKKKKKRQRHRGKSPLSDEYEEDDSEREAKKRHHRKKKRKYRTSSSSEDSDSEAEGKKELLIQRQFSYMYQLSIGKQHKDKLPLCLPKDDIDTFCSPQFGKARNRTGFRSIFKTPHGDCSSSHCSNRAAFDDKPSCSYSNVIDCPGSESTSTLDTKEKKKNLHPFKVAEGSRMQDSLPPGNYLLIYMNIELFDTLDISQIGACLSDGPCFKAYVLPHYLKARRGFTSVGEKKYYRTSDTLHLALPVISVLQNFLRFIEEQRGGMHDGMLLFSTSQEASSTLLEALLMYNLMERFKDSVRGMGHIQSLVGTLNGESVRDLSQLVGGDGPLILSSIEQGALILQNVLNRLLNGESPSYNNFFRFLMVPPEAPFSTEVTPRRNFLIGLADELYKTKPEDANRIRNLGWVLSDNCDLDLEALSQPPIKKSKIQKVLKNNSTVLNVSTKLLDLASDYLMKKGYKKKKTHEKVNHPKKEPVDQSSDVLYKSDKDSLTKCIKSICSVRGVPITQKSILDFLSSAKLGDQDLSYSLHFAIYTTDDMFGALSEFKKYLESATTGVFADKELGLPLPVFIDVMALFYKDNYEPLLTRATHKQFLSLPSSISPPQNKMFVSATMKEFEEYLISRMSKPIPDKPYYAAQMSSAVEHAFSMSQVDLDAILQRKGDVHGVYKDIYAIFHNFKIPGLHPRHVANFITSLFFRNSTTMPCSDAEMITLA